jgi:pantoate--beta-alanine ligase
MEVIRTPDEARQLTVNLRQSGRTVGIVPTMGALHQGHLSLVQRSRQQCDATLATIFVNPTQFGPGEDLDKYPRTLDDDCAMLSHAGVTAVFVPESVSMYPGGFSTYIEPPEVARPFEGICRPGHFRGVATIVLKLFHAIPATHAYFGKKDYQQWKVIEAMARDLDVGITIVGVETMRDPDGLAMSSRNRYLSPAERRRGLRLSAALCAMSAAVAAGERSVETLEGSMRRQLLGVGQSEAEQTSDDNAGVDRIDYAAIADAQTLSPISVLDRPAVALIAAYVGSTRLIDNREISPA